jgi:glutamate 5-kinase
MPGVSAADRKENARVLVEAKRVVVKVGSALLVDQASGRVNRQWLETLADDIARLRRC